MTTDSRLEALGWHHRYSGKVRDLYESSAHPGRLLVVTSDRVSAFDHVLSPGIPGKGALLTQLSMWWFGRLGEPTHLAAAHPSLGEHLPTELAGRTMIVHALEMFPIECVVRGYLAGSGWVEYRASQSVCGVPLPAGLSEGDKLPEPIFTPAFKAPLGAHDENITFERMAELVGLADAEALRDVSLRIFATASAIAEERGILLADSKFEFGRDPETGGAVLADEVLTSDSSRYWDAATYAAGGPGRLESFDKQIVRDWLAANWDRTGDPPELPADIVERTAERYRELVETDRGAAVIEIRQVPWDHPDSDRLRADQQAEIATRYGRLDSEPGPVPTAADMSVFFVAYDRDEAVGCGGLRALDERHGEIKRMYVVPRRRGSGVAAAMLRHLEVEGRSRGWDRLVLETGDEQPDAMRFYEREGYTRIPNFGYYADSELSICYEKRY